MADRIQQRRDTAARWAQYNPVLLEGEVGYVTDNPNQYKIGDGIHAWNDLPLRGYTGTIVQELGDDENSVVSQKTITEAVNNLNANTGVSDYEDFSNTKAYSVGDIVKYNGLLYTFIIDHEAGEWNKTEVENGSIRDLIYKFHSNNLFLRDFILGSDLERGTYLSVIDKPLSKNNTYTSNRLRSGMILNKSIIISIANESELELSIIYVDKNNIIKNIVARRKTIEINNTYPISYLVISKNNDEDITDEDIKELKICVTDNSQPYIKITEAVNNLNANTGVSDYEDFSNTKAYSVGDIVKYNGLLYTFIIDHEAGEWNKTEVENGSIRDLIYKFHSNNLFLRDFILGSDLERGTYLSVIDKPLSKNNTYTSNRLRSGMILNKSIIISIANESELELSIIYVDKNNIIKNIVARRKTIEINNTYPISYLVISKNNDEDITDEDIKELKICVTDNSQPYIKDSSTSDFEIADEYGNSIVQFLEGHIRTKNFDSRKINVNSQYPLSGKKLSILGDSISTYQGYLPSGYATFFPTEDVDNVNKTWWKMLIDETNMELGQNCAWSGSPVSGDGESTSNAYAGCSTKRVNDLSLNGIPDIIIIFIGINDFGPSPKPLGDWSAKNSFPEDGTKNTFSEAYALMLSKVITKYPKAQVFCCTLLQSGKDSKDMSEPNVYPTKNTLGNTLDEYNDIIRNISIGYGCPVIELGTCGIRFGNFNYYTVGDNLHPNYEGHKLMYKIIKNNILKYY